MADVARAAGVSPMTVSRVINSEPNVQAATRQKVMAAVAALGYVPNAAARMLAGGRQCRFALLHSNPSAAYLSEFLMGSLAQAAQIDAQLLVEYCGGNESAEALALRLVQHRVDAVLLPPPLCDDEALRAALGHQGLPLVQIATGRAASDVHAVTIDDEAAAHAMTAHLIALGHRRIGFVTGSPNQTASTLRQAGFERALAETGIASLPELIAPGSFTYRSGLEAAEALLALSSQPTAIFASNDDMAAAAVAVAHRHRLDVPGDVSVCGFDDTAMATTIWPELTTIRQPIAAMARLAMRLLVDSLRNIAASRPDPVRHERLKFELIRRASDSSPGGAVWDEV